MRLAMILIGGGALALAGCGDKDQGDAIANADTGLTAETIGSNDATAIDAVTGEAANMAADVEFDANAADDVPDNATAPATRSSPRSSSSPSRPAPRPAPAPAAGNDGDSAPEPAANSE